jgi:hypothetical protein
VIAIGSRERSNEPDSIGFTVDEVAKRQGASVEENTTDGDVAYAPVPNGVTSPRSERLPTRRDGASGARRGLVM